MTAKETIVWIAEKERGYSENPPNSNRTKYGKAFGLDGVPWCALFVSFCYSKAGVTLPKIGFAKPGFAGCQTAAAYFAKAGMLTVTPEPGDIVLYDWNQDGRFDHTGIYQRKIDAATFYAIEGNTAVGNDSNGGQVMQRRRKVTNAIFVRIP